MYCVRYKYENSFDQCMLAYKMNAEIWLCSRLTGFALILP